MEVVLVIFVQVVFTLQVLFIHGGLLLLALIWVITAFFTLNFNLIFIMKLAGDSTLSPNLELTTKSTIRPTSSHLRVVCHRHILSNDRLYVLKLGSSSGSHMCLLLMLL